MVEIISVVIIFALVFVIKKIFEPPHIKRIDPDLALKGYKLFYTDQKVKERQDGVVYSKLLQSEKYDLQGKPDYIVRKGKQYIPVELKSGTVGDANFPHDGDVMQLVAYFLIIEDLYNGRVRVGRIIYKDATFVVRNTRSIRRTLFKRLKRMRAMLKTGKGTACPSFQHCRFCIARDSVCEFYPHKDKREGEHKDKSKRKT